MSKPRFKHPIEDLQAIDELLTRMKKGEVEEIHYRRKRKNGKQFECVTVLPGGASRSGWSTQGIHNLAVLFTEVTKDSLKWGDMFKRIDAQREKESAS